MPLSPNYQQPPDAVNDEEKDSRHTDDEGDPADDQPELFSTIDLDEENGVRTELYNHPGVKKAMKTLRARMRTSIERPSKNLR